MPLPESSSMFVSSPKVDRLIRGRKCLTTRSSERLMAVGVFSEFHVHRAMSRR